MADRREDIDRERWHLLRQINHMLEMPLAVLGFVWLALLVLELTGRLDPAWQRVSLAIWILFVADFALEFLLAPVKRRFLRTNWLSALSLALPALRVLRVARALRVLRLTRTARALRLARVLTGLNRGLGSLRRTMRRRGLGYVLGLTAVVAVAGAAGMYAFEHESGPPAGFGTYASALWWTLMLLTSMGSEYWPRTGAGRTLCLLLSIYGFAVFGYITAALASYFVDRDTRAAARTAGLSGPNPSTQPAAGT